MKEILIKIRNGISKTLYRFILKPLFFRIDPGSIHEAMTFCGQILGSNFITRGLTGLAFNYRNKSLNQKIHGIRFCNPIGLAGGFDKDAKMTKIIPKVGFGFMEIGSITGDPYKGNPKPHAWRLPKIKSLMINYGLKNKGADAISKKLHGQKFRIPVAVNIAKTNSAKTATVKAGIADYVYVYRKFKTIGDFFVLNISCPNTFGGEPFHDPKKLNQLLNAIKQYRNKKPIFIKISPDLTKKEIDEIINIAKKHKIHGFVCTNLTKKVADPKEVGPLVGRGSISGKFIEDKSNEIIRYVYKKTNGEFTIIGVGGVFSAEDAYKKIKLGASLVELITGMIYQGPQTVSEINQGLAKLLKKDGFANVTEAVGINVLRKSRGNVGS